MGSHNPVLGGADLSQQGPPRTSGEREKRARPVSRVPNQNQARGVGYFDAVPVGGAVACLTPRAYFFHFSAAASMISSDSDPRRASVLSTSNRMLTVVTIAGESVVMPSAK